MNIPNSITLIRMIMVPIIVWLILAEQMYAAFLAFLLAGASDALDGLIAKQFDLVTPLGTYLDPLADKILLVSIYVTLGVQQDLPSWLVILVVSRDILIVGAILLTFLLELNIAIVPSKLSKLNTFCQISLAAIVLGDLGLDMGFSGLIELFVYIVSVTTVLSGLTYILQWSRQNS
ncbi:CDP-alcohol phosphatidyltransferase family protein [Sneathiella chungangensis]|uniref:CDP-diacylglycerol--glycerol-3-phosphate 3-phosphatidyltransferase n=1 Tax=Sneathiella chungangensis TaxID=1418234 RepID=A0A845MCL9_9PROT|nr:CDP-alcohol phosphatidyltransferase family protein [Sneathiella chungangensis]MZR20834.1 CDP-alcohol phosphatidyltransferase family protein [Sneathiella chungangensis]